MEIDLLKSALAKLKLTLGGKTTSDILTNICFRNQKAITWNGVTGTILKFPLPFECCVNGEDFLDQVSKLDSDVELELKKDTLHLKSGGLSAKFKTIPALEFPDFVPKDRSELTADDPSIIIALDAVLPFVGKEVNALGGICIVQDKVYACNGKSATKSILTKPLTHMVHFPDTFAKSVVKAGSPICLFRANEMVGAYYEDQVLLTSQIVSRFPHEMVDESFNIEGPEVVLPDELDKVLKRITPSADETGAAWLTSSQGTLSVVSDTASEGIAWEGPDFKVRINLKRLGAAAKMTKRVKLGSAISEDPRALLFVGEHCLHTLGLQSE